MGDEPVNVADILERFRRNTTVRFKEGSHTPGEYAQMFRRFAKNTDLCRYTRRQLAGTKGRELLLAHMGAIPIRSRRFVLAGVQCVWEEGIGLPFPVNRKRDFGKTLPPVGRRHTPPDGDVKEWAEAVAHEKDPILKALVLCELQYGWRAENQVGHLKRAHVLLDGNGRPCAVVADGLEARFKTSASIVAWTPPDASEALDALMKAAPGKSPDAPLFWASYRRDTKDATGGMAHRKGEPRPLSDRDVLRLFNLFERKHDLAHIAPVYLRHWVKTACRRLGLSDPAMAAWQGHKAPNDGSMRNVYDNPRQEALLDEQMSVMPHGPLGLLKAPEVKVLEGPERDIADVAAKYASGEIGPMELIDRLDRIRRKTVESPALER